MSVQMRMKSPRVMRSEPILQPLQEVHALMQDGDYDRSVAGEPDDVMILAPKHADIVGEFIERSRPCVAFTHGVAARRDPLEGPVGLVGSPRLVGIASDVPRRQP